jgi:hypothetical protein
LNAPFDGFAGQPLFENSLPVAFADTTGKAAGLLKPATSPSQSGHSAVVRSLDSESLTMH